MENGFSMRSYRPSRLILIVSLLSLGVLPASALSQTIKKTVDHVPGGIVVKIRDSALLKGARATVLSSLQTALGAHSVSDVHLFRTDSSLHSIRLSKDSDLQSALALLRADPSVEIAEPNYIYRAFDDGMPNDPEFGKLWGLKNSGQTDAAGQVGNMGSDINVFPLWKEGFVGSRKVIVAVIDTGIDWTHPDLEANLFTNPGEAGDLGTNGKDDDNNGFIDDIHGWNFEANTNNSNDDHNHGSHCSGTIGGVGNNGKGVVGVNWNATLMPIKFLSAEGSGSLEGAVNAINYATMMKVNVMSNSWGGGGASETMKDAIVKAKDAGILFVAAAGNEQNDNDSKPSYPASYDVANVMAVSATDNLDKLAGFSNFGEKTVHVAAPGVKILSAWKNGTYGVYSGTSMATPHVAGIAALLWAGNPSWTFSEIKDRLIRTSDPVQSLRHKVQAKGRVNAYNAFHNIVPPSQEPDEKLWKDVAMTVESTHPYKDSANLTFNISQPGAKFIRVHFEKIDTEQEYDFLSVENAKGESLEIYSGAKANMMTDYVVGDTAVIRIKSDESNNGYGFKIDRIQVITQ